MIHAITGSTESLLFFTGLPFIIVLQYGCIECHQLVRFRNTNRFRSNDCWDLVGKKSQAKTVEKSKTNPTKVSEIRNVGVGGGGVTLGTYI